MMKESELNLKQENRLYKISTPIIAITGGIACGKTTACDLLRKLGHTVLDADQLVKDIYKTNEALSFISKLSPKAVNGNTINFKILREWFFTSEQNKQKVEEFIYGKLENQFMIHYNKIPKKDFIFYDIPLLFERDMKSLFDITICIYASSLIQIKRLIKRDQISEQLAKNILSKQIDIEIKKKRSDIVLDNNSDYKQLKTNIDHLNNKLISRFNNTPSI